MAKKISPKKAKKKVVKKAVKKVVKKAVKKVVKISSFSCPGRKDFKKRR